MKKNLMALALCAGLLLVGCGSKNPTTASTPQEAASSVPAGKTESTVSGVSSAAESVGSDDGGYDSAPTTTDTSNDGDYSDFLDMPDYKGYQLALPAGKTAEKGMIVNIDYEGTIDGEKFEGGSAKGFDLTLGSGQFINGFEDQLIGHKKGDTVDVTVTFPKDYGVDSLNGKEAHFKTKINEVKANTPDSALTDLRDRSTVKSYPQDLVDKWVNIYRSDYQAAADAAGQDLDAYLESIGVTSDMIETNAKNTVKTDMLCRTIAAKEGVKKGDPLYKEAASSLTLENGEKTTAEGAAAMGLSEDRIEAATYLNLALKIIEENAAAS